MITGIVGLGLMGGSFALVMRDKNLTDKIIGCDFNPENAQKAKELGIVDEVVSLDDIIKTADLIVISIPVNSIPQVAIKILNKVNDKQIVMDLGSTKHELCETICMHKKRDRFVATHPMWGTEKSGPESAQKNAFKGRTVVLCQSELSDKDALKVVENIYTAFGMPIKYMNAEEHDTHAAYVSHISHITSFALALTVLEKERETEHIFDLAGGGFESTVRLAKSSYKMWVPIFMQNKYNVLDVLREHIHQLQVMRRCIEKDDEEGLTKMISSANTINKILK